jgi:hypothetical protein
MTQKNKRKVSDGLMQARHGDQHPEIDEANDNRIIKKLTNTKMRINASIACSSCKVLVLSVRNVLMSLRIPVLLGQPEVDHMHLIPTLPQTHQKVIRLDVSVDEVF